MGCTIYVSLRWNCCQVENDLDTKDNQLSVLIWEQWYFDFKYYTIQSLCFAYNDEYFEHFVHRQNSELIVFETLDETKIENVEATERRIAL